MSAAVEYQAVSATLLLRAIANGISFEDLYNKPSMPIHHHLTFPLILVIAGIGSVLSMMAARNNTAPWYVPLWSRKQNTFTASGWRYRSWSLWCGYVAVAVVVADQLIASS